MARVVGTSSTALSSPNPPAAHGTHCSEDPNLHGGIFITFSNGDRWPTAQWGGGRITPLRSQPWYIRRSPNFRRRDRPHGLQSHCGICHEPTVCSRSLNAVRPSLYVELGQSVGGPEGAVGP